MDRDNHFQQYIEGSPYVVLLKDEFDILARRSFSRPCPQLLKGADGITTHIVLLADEYEELINFTPDPELVYYIKMPDKGVCASGLISGEFKDTSIGVYAGSSVGKIVPSLRRHSQPYMELREQLEQDDTIALCEGELRFIDDYTFDNFSQAACIVMGRPASGNTEWKNRDGVPLRESMFCAQR
jgi:hypothetical protein